jgi:hypothetical protein
MTGQFLPGAKWRPISYRAAAGKFTHPPLGYIVHVPVSNGSLFPYFNGLKSPARKFCTAFIFKDGTSEQYTTLDMKAWAQGDGNGDYWSFEVEGFPNEPMTDSQLDTLARWHKFLGTEDRIATAPGQRGIGTHQMGGRAWGGHSCPGPIRTAQLPQIIQRANGAAPSKEWDDMTPEQSAKLDEAWARVYATQKNVQAVSAALRALASSLPAATAKAVTDVLSADYDAKVELTPKEN